MTAETVWRYGFLIEMNTAIFLCCYPGREERATVPDSTNAQGKEDADEENIKIDRGNEMLYS